VSRMGYRGIVEGGFRKEAERWLMRMSERGLACTAARARLRVTLS
jgi:hypothetical protein